MLYMLGGEKSAKKILQTYHQNLELWCTEYLLVEEIADIGSTFNYLFSPVEPPLRKDPLEV